MAFGRRSRTGAPSRPAPPPNKMSEMALAHTVPDKVEAAYRRGGWQRGADKGVILCLYIWNFDAEQGPATLH